MVGTPVTGAAVAPPGIIPNFEHPTDVFKTYNLVTHILCLAFTTPCIILRMYIRIGIVKEFGMGDWFCLTASILGTSFFISGIIMGELGGGYHDWEISAHALMSYKEALYIDIVIHSPTLFFTKVTLLYIFVKVFVPFRKTVIGIYIFTGLITIYYGIVTGFKLRICSPPAGFWDRSRRISCINTTMLFEADTIVSVVTDIIILVLPIPLMWSLQMPLRKRLGICALLGAGGLATSMSVMRLVLQMVDDLPDSTLGSLRFKMLSSAEISIALICACLPSFHVLYARFVKPMLSKSNTHTSDPKFSGIRRISTRMGVGKSGGQISRVEFGSDEDILLERVLANPFSREIGQAYTCEIFSNGRSDSLGHERRQPSQSWKLSGANHEHGV